MKVFAFSCPNCKYESRHLLGTPDMDQTLTDVNTEFAQYRLFVCRKEQKFVHADILDGSFEGRCSSDGAELEEVGANEAKCPRCGSDLQVRELEPLSAGDSTAE